MITTSLIYDASIYGLIGIFAGLMSGIFGIGGGIIVVPGLLFVFQHTPIIPDKISMQIAAASSLTVMIFTSQAALLAHYRLGEIKWSIYNKLWPGLVVGALYGAILADVTPTRLLEVIFSIFMLLLAVKMLFDVHTVHADRFPKLWVNRFITACIGLPSGLLGIGGGVFIIPYLTYCGLDARKIAPVSNLCTLTVGIVGTTVFMLTGLNETVKIPYTTGYVYWPAVFWVAIASSFAVQIGAKLNYVLPVKHLKYIFIIILLLTAIHLMF